MNTFRYLHVVLIFVTVALLVIFSRCDEETLQPPPPPPPEPDTTSHDFTWTTYYLGDGQSYLQDVFAVNDTDVWAVGEIYLKDSTGNLNLDPYNVAHWNGHDWTLSQIYSGGWIPTPLSAVYGFSKNDIWVGSSIPSKWDGSQWIHYGKEQGYNSFGRISRVWGRSSSDLYFVGAKGSIMHYNGRTFLPMESWTTTGLGDISGTFNGKIYACGGDLSSVVLEYDGSSWKRIDSLSGKLQRWAVYAAEGFLGFGGYGVIYTDTRYADTMRQPPMSILEGKEINGLPVGTTCIRGSSRKNVFAAGSWQYVIHYNGSNWKWYEELWDDDEHQQYGMAVTENAVYIVGSKGERATILRGIRR